MRKFGLIGSSLKHSFSSDYFNNKFGSESITNCTYENFEIQTIDELVPLVTSLPDLIGLNVTIPFKESVIPFLKELDEEAKAIGAVNTITIYPQDDQLHLKGFNTDAHAFRKSLAPLLSSNHSSALILGAGGAGKAAGYALRSMGIEVVYVSRNPEMVNLDNEEVISYSDLSQSRISKHLVVINSTPQGMHPNLNSCPDIPYEYLTTNHLLYDLIYNPAETLFLMKGKENGAKTKNGQEMLELQAELSWEIWNS
jgi:shikimate dehydrogenase